MFPVGVASWNFSGYNFNTIKKATALKIKTAKTPQYTIFHCVNFFLNNKTKNMSGNKIMSSASLESQYGTNTLEAIARKKENSFPFTKFPPK